MTALVIGGFMIAAFFLTIHPIWSIIDVATSKRQSSAAKTIWIILCFITWSFASVIYGLVFADGRALAVTTRILVIGFVIIALIAGGLMIAVPMARNSLPGFSINR